MAKGCGFCAAAGIPRKKEGSKAAKPKADSLHPRRRYDRGPPPGEARVTA